MPYTNDEIPNRTITEAKKESRNFQGDTPRTVGELQDYLRDKIIVDEMGIDTPIQFIILKEFDRSVIAMNVHAHIAQQMAKVLRAMYAKEVAKLRR